MTTESDQGLIRSGSTNSDERAPHSTSRAKTGKPAPPAVSGVEDPAPTDPVLTFGENKGKRLSETSDEWLDWAADNLPSATGELRRMADAIVAESKRREKRRCRVPDVEATRRYLDDQKRRDDAIAAERRAVELWADQHPDLRQRPDEPHHSWAGRRWTAYKQAHGEKVA
jgi:hypothetical protein